MGGKGTEGDRRQAHLDADQDAEPDERVDRHEDEDGRREPAIEGFKYEGAA